MIKIDKINSRILYELDKNCRISDNQLAKLVNRSRESVRNRINKLVKDDIIQGFILSINPTATGCIGFKMYFQLKNNITERERFSNYFKKLEGIYWFAESDGVWDFHATFYVESISKFNEIKNKIFTEFKDLIVKRDTGVLVNVRQFTRKFLFPQIHERPLPYKYGEPQKISYLVDELDKQILLKMSTNARIPIVTLAQKTNSTVDIVRNRIKKFENSNIIFQYRIALNHTKLGYSMYKAFVYFDNLTPAIENKLISYATQETRIFNLIRQISSWDIELEIMAKSYEEFTEIMNNIRSTFKEVIRNYELILIKDENWVFDESHIFF
ncbi:MAG: Lrp/AsnC family transcriptional regulator [Candidatus Woesearchaeota archaeon]|jgi:DNA-binding Lrp family transcriptional regulator